MARKKTPSPAPDPTTAKHLAAIDATFQVLQVQLQMLRHHLGMRVEPAARPGPAEEDDRPERCRQVPIERCGLRTDDEDARLSLETFGGDAWKCLGCGFRSDRDERDQ